jgi:hypothetical protein
VSGKNQFPYELNWQSANPQTGFQPNPYPGGSKPSGVTSGTMTGTATTYSNIIDISRMDNIGAEVFWSGTPTGTITVLCSVSGQNWSNLTFNPPLAQPSGSGAGYLIDLNQVPYKYIMFQYINSSGTGSLTVWLQFKDLN